MAFIPYSRQDVNEADIAALAEVLRSDFLTQGPQVPAFEEAFAAAHQVGHAVAVSNATAGLQLACLALGAGSGSVIWTTPNSFLASANCALYCGATVDFVDIDPLTRNMGTAALSEKLLEAATRNALPDIVIPVDFAGLPCNLREIRALAERHGFKILEDASHATGASFEGHPVGSRFADASVFSFHAVKIITTGEGGMVTTQDNETARQLRLLRSHGMTRQADEMEHQPDGPWYYEQQALGYNFRMTDIQAALGLSQLTRLNAMRARREALAARYDRLLSNLPVVLPPRLPECRSAWHLYVIEVDATRTPTTRLAVFERLRAAGIGVNVHYIPIHTQPFYQRMGFKRGDFPFSEHYYAQAITLPLYPALSESDQDLVVATLTETLG